jgi:quinol monooxygenase YgiN
VYAILARFTVQPGKMDEVIGYLNQASIPSLAEPGCHLYIANRDRSDADVLVMYEQYTDEGAFQAHLASDHFSELVAGKVVPLLIGRRRETFDVVPFTAPS